MSDFCDCRSKVAKAHALRPGFFRCVAQNPRIPLNSYSLCFLYLTCFSLRSDVLHTVVHSVQVPTLPTVQATPVLTESFSRGHDLHAHACEARPQTTVGWTSLSLCCHCPLNILQECCRIPTHFDEMKTTSENNHSAVRAPTVSPEHILLTPSWTRVLVDSHAASSHRPIAFPLMLSTHETLLHAPKLFLGSWHKLARKKP